MNLNWISKGIVLHALGDKGKSTTLLMLCDMLEGKRILKRNYPSGKPTDIRKCISYQGKCIGICSEGDDADAILNNFIFFAENNCEIVVTALHVRKKNKTKAVPDEALALICKEHGLKLTYIRKKTTDVKKNEFVTCKGQAQVLFKQINSWL